MGQAVDQDTTGSKMTTMHPPAPIADATRKPPAGAPGPERLHAAITLVVERLQPDQIILFGSAARNEMSEWSDLDLLVIKESGEGSVPPRHDRWECPRSGDELDVIVMDRATAERHRLSASHIQGAALEEGRTVYVREGITPTTTGPTYTWNGTQVVKTTKFEPDHSNGLLEQAERKWETANREKHPVDKCEYLQQSMERALKALITADGRRVEHTHELNKLWEQAEANGERIEATRNPKHLEKLSRYAGAWRYAVPPDEEPATTWSENRIMGEDLLNHARRRVPQLIQETRNHLQSRQAQPGNDLPDQSTPNTWPEIGSGTVFDSNDAAPEGRLGEARKSAGQRKPVRMGDLPKDPADAPDPARKTSMRK
jgi:HEPN domain-containing protein